MQLEALRPKQGASLIQLRNLLEGRGWRSAMPMSLPDSVLLRLARDFRCVEAGPDTLESGAQPLSAAMYVVTSLLLDHPGRTGDKNKLQISDLGLMRALQIYQIGIEREIVTRITGLPCCKPPEAMADDLLQCTSEQND